MTRLSRPLAVRDGRPPVGADTAVTANGCRDKEVWVDDGLRSSTAADMELSSSRPSTMGSGDVGGDLVAGGRCWLDVSERNK